MSQGVPAQAEAIHVPDDDAITAVEQAFVAADGFFRAHLAR